jgi:hypothetical protein
VVRRDSAGVTIIDNHAPAWTDGGGWSVEPAPLIEIGAGTAEEHQLFEVRDVRRLSNGSILIAEPTRFRIFDANGTLTREFGRQGRGPGEFSQMASAFECDGRIWVGELFDTRVSEVDEYGSVELHQAVPAVAALSQSLAGCLNHRPVAVYHVPDRTSPPPDEIRRQDAAIAFVDGVVPDSIATVRMREGRRGLLRPFGRTDVYDVAGDLLVTGDNGTSEIHVRSPAGAVERIVRLGLPTVTVTSQDQERILAQYTEGVPATILSEIQPLLDDMPFHETMPYFSAIHVVEDGTLWIQEYSGFRGEQPTGWIVIDAEGRWLGDVEMPAGLNVHDIGSDWVLGVWRDANDVERVRLHRIITGSDRTVG